MGKTKSKVPDEFVGTSWHCRRCDKTLPAECFYYSFKKRLNRYYKESYCTKCCFIPASEFPPLVYKYNLEFLDCNKCGLKNLPRDKFRWHFSQSKKMMVRYTMCIECQKIKDKKYDTIRQSNLEIRDRRSKQNKASRYGITIEEYEYLYATHETCSSCKNTPAKGKNLVIDHDHSTGLIRGLLCGNCNLGIGHFKDCKDKILNAALYLERHNNIASRGA